jgi:hypothetical protein
VLEGLWVAASQGAANAAAEASAAAVCAALKHAQREAVCASQLASNGAFLAATSLVLEEVAS